MGNLRKPSGIKTRAYPVVVVLSMEAFSTTFTVSVTPPALMVTTLSLVVSTSVIPDCTTSRSLRIRRYFRSSHSHARKADKRPSLSGLGGASLLV